MRQRILGNMFGGIVHTQTEIVLLFLQDNLDSAAVIGIFHGIVQENGQQLTDGPFIAAHRKHRLDLRGEIFMLRSCQGLECLHSLLHQIGEREVDLFRLGQLLHPR